MAEAASQSEDYGRSSYNLSRWPKQPLPSDRHSTTTTVIVRAVGNRLCRSIPCTFAPRSMPRVHSARICGT